MAEPPDDIKSGMTKVANQTITLDGQVFKNTHFENCILVYRGGTLPALIGDYFDRCSWRFEDHAGRTVDFLRALATGGPGADEFVVKELLGIRS